ncbi:MAG: hypothetical protein AB7R55_00520 [Gemmatimonadales bacterium]
MSRRPVATGEPPLPLVVQIGFAGSRQLLAAGRSAPGQTTEFEEALEPLLTARLAALPGELGLSAKHFCCGISQLAIGADTLFTRACATLGWDQRLFLPQAREQFLHAGGAEDPDFTTSEREAATRLFGLPHIIQERVVSAASVRQEQFEDVSAELVRVSDLIVCLVRSGAVGARGGSRALIEEAVRRKRAVLELRVSSEEGRPVIEEERWHNRGAFVVPAAPPELDRLKADLAASTSVDDYYDALKTFGTQVADWRKTVFRLAALVIIGSHVAATIMAAYGSTLPHTGPGLGILQALLAAELVTLSVGWLTHTYLHRSRASEIWAMSRLTAEVARSGLAVRDVPEYLSHLFTLPLPHSLRPILRTVNVLHLRDAARAVRREPWEARRDRYVASRLRGPSAGQIPYYQRKHVSAKRWTWLAQGFFSICSLAAIAVAGYKLATLGAHPESELAAGAEAAKATTGAALLAVAAIVLPVAAVAAISLAAAFDLEARIHTFGEMLEFLERRAEDLEQTTSERAFVNLVLFTEGRLLGENANWYARRAYTGVT